MSLSLLRKYKSWFLKAKRICILSTYCVCLARDYIRIRKTNEFLAPDRSILPTIWIRVQDDVSIFINHPQIYMVFVAAILVMWYANGKSRSTEQIFSQMKINTYEYKRIQLSYWFTVLHVHCIAIVCSVNAKHTTNSRNDITKLQLFFSRIWSLNGGWCTYSTVYNSEWNTKSWADEMSNVLK